MEGRRELLFYRNPSEELFMKSWPSADTSSTIDMIMGFKNLSPPHAFRTDSEELFRTWLTNGDHQNPNNNNNNPSSGIAYRTRRASTRISNEIVDLSSPQHVVKHDILQPQSQPLRNNNFDHELQVHGSSSSSSNLYLAKAWFHSSQPMTRSRSSELRRRYAVMQNNESSIGMELEFSSMFGIFEHGLNPMKLDDLTNSPSQPLLPHMYEVDQISSVVNMLKGTLQRKKLKNKPEQQLEEDDEDKEDSHSNAHLRPHETLTFNTSSDSYMHQIPNSLPQYSPVEVKDNTSLQTAEGLGDLGFEAFVNPIRSSRVSQEPSQSESSAAAAALVVVSPGFESCDGPCNTESSRKHIAGTRSTDFRERIIIDNLKDERKRGSLVRYGSVTSAASVEKGDPTKKRRVERSRKMAEAKERNMSPSIPLDMQSVVKRCENLEKEVRSLKLNLSFMNRKDSEQTKQIEDLQKRNEDMADEKERLLQQIERILSQNYQN